jgi:hypothetical protein
MAKRPKFSHTFKVSGKPVTFTDPRGIFWLGVTVDDSMPTSVPGANPEDLDEILIAAQDMASKALAKQARSTMSAYFKKGSPKFKGIYWRGNSAKGISVDQKPQGSPGAVMYQIRERRASLRVIRQGLQPPDTRKPHSKDFEQWIKDKKLQYIDPDTGNKRRPKNKEQQEAIKWRVRQHIISYGIGDYWESNGLVKGVENRQFNYPQYYRENDARQEFEKVMESLFQHGDKNGFRALIDSVVWGALSSARFQTSDTNKVNTRRDYGIGHKYRKQNLWQNYGVAFSGDEGIASEVTESWADRIYAARIAKNAGVTIRSKW